MNSQDAINEVVEYNHTIGVILTEICGPILSNFGFNSFGYTRIYDNGNRLILETNKQWLEYYSDIKFLEKDHGKNSIIYNLTNLLAEPQESHILVLSGNPNSKMHERLFACGIWNSVSIYIHLKNFVEIYHLSSSMGDSSQVMDLCINKKYLLQRFIHYFREKLHALDIERAPCVRDANLSKIIAQPIANEIISDSDKIQSYIRQTRASKYYLKTHQRFISRREMECLHHLSVGRSLKEIARILNISPRTVESHINTLKDKTDSHTKNNLVNIAQENHINSQDFFLSINSE